MSFQTKDVIRWNVSKWKRHSIETSPDRNVTNLIAFRLTLLLEDGVAFLSRRSLELDDREGWHVDAKFSWMEVDCFPPASKGWPDVRK